MLTDIEQNDVSKKPLIPHYSAKTKELGWGIDMTGTYSVDYHNIDYAGVFGLSMTNFTVEAEGIKKARVKNKRGYWLWYSDAFDKTKGLGDDTPIVGLEIVGAGYLVGVHIKGGTWLNAVKTSDKEGEVLIGNGAPIDAIWIDKI